MVFHECSAYMKKWLLQQSHVKEESLTDWLLFNVSNKLQCIYYQAFSRHEESYNGSDWEWWVVTPHEYKNDEYYAYRFLVQAKKLLPRDRDNYPLLSYGNKNGLQIDLLLQSAKDVHAFPLYMFYSTGERDIKEQIKNSTFISEATLRWCEPCDNGGYLASASEIYELVHAEKRKKYTDDKLLNHSYQLSLCDLIFGKSGIESEKMLTRFNDALIHQLNEKTNAKYVDINVKGIKHYGNEIPSYLSLFVENRGREISWFESEMHRKLRNIGGLGVIDLRQEFDYEE